MRPNPWDGGTGGVGYTDWNPEPYLWLAGEYEVQIFVGLSWKTSGRFTVEGQPPTAVPSATPSPTRTSTSTLAPPSPFVRQTHVCLLRPPPHVLRSIPLL